MFTRMLCTIVLCLSGALALTYCTLTPRPTYITETGIEPDKWATVWLIRRHLDPEASIVMREVGTPLDGGIVFAAGSGRFGRSPTQSAFSNMLATLPDADPALTTLAGHLNIIELSSWMAASDPGAATIESAYRQLQEHYGRDAVPEACYLSFFDHTIELIKDQRLHTLPDVTRRLTMPQASCQGSQKIVNRDSSAVRRATTGEALTRIASGERIVFVDVREAPEFAEDHIPGAMHRTLRDIDQSFADELKAATLVVPYCVKDFRGYEAARELQRLGVTNVAILEPFGIAGWKSQGLPLWRPNGISEAKAVEELHLCASKGLEKCVRIQG